MKRLECFLKKMERGYRAEINKISRTRNVLNDVFVNIIRKKTAAYKYITENI